MKVGELIKALQGYDEDMDVVYGYYQPIRDIYITHIKEVTYLWDRTIFEYDKDGYAVVKLSP